MKKIFNIIEIILIMLFFIFQNMIDFSNISFYLILFLIISLYLYTNKSKDNWNVRLFSFLFSFIFTFGNLSVYKYSSTIILGLVLLIELIGGYFLFNKLFIFLKDNYKKINISSNNRLKGKWFIIISIVIGFLCFLPYFLKYYPGVLTPDSYNSMAQINHFIGYSNHHPWIYTLLIKFFYSIGLGITGSKSFGVAFFILFQMFVASITFTYVTYTLYKNNINKILVLLVWMFFFLMPFNAIYTVTMWKDIIFSYIVLVLSTFIINHYKNNLEWDFKSKSIFTILVILFALFRSNGLISYLLLILLMFIIYRKELMKLKFSILISLICIFIFKVPIMNAFNVTPPDFVESLSIPIQQIAYVVKNDGDINKYEMNEIKKICDIDSVKEDKGKYYVISDRVKWNIRRNDKNEYLEKHKFKYFKIWLTIGIKNPRFYIQGYVKQTSGFWYHNYGEYWVYSESLINNLNNGYIGVERHDYLPKKMSNFITTLLENNKNIYYLLWSCAMGFYVILISMFIAIEKKENILAYIPTIAIVITLMIATPVASEFRYAYAVYLCFPMLLLMTLINKNEHLVHRKIRKKKKKFIL